MIDPHTNKRKWRVFFVYAPLFIWSVVILGLGSSVGAATETSHFIRPLLEYLFPAASPETLAFYHGYIRKFAHFTEYAVLALLAFRAFSSRTWLSKFPFLSAATLVLTVASVDEINQSFNPSRTGSTWDVSIDLAGGATALVVIYAIKKRRSRERP